MWDGFRRRVASSQAHPRVVWQAHLQYSDATAASCLVLYDLGSLLGGVLYSSGLDHLTMGQLLVPLALLLSALLLALPMAAAQGSMWFGLVLLLTGSTFGGLELLGSGGAAGCVVDMVGGSLGGTIPGIVGAITGLGSLASLAAVSSVSTLLDLLGWRRLFTVGAALALAAAFALLPTMRRRAPMASGMRAAAQHAEQPQGSKAKAD